MTTEVLGTAYVDIVARTDKVPRQVKDGLKGAEQAAQASGDRMGKHLADGVEKGTSRAARSSKLLANVFTSNSAQALGPLQEVADKVELIGTTLEQTRTKAGGALLGIGAAATGVGAFLSTLASREEGATNRLAAAIAAQGGNIDDYRGRIDEAVKAGERLGQSGNQTIDAIQALTLGLHDPKKALDELGLAEDIAAAKQISLSSAANLVRQAYNGNTRVLKAFGIQVDSLVDGQKLLKTAHDDATKASTTAASAQKTYSEKLELYRQAAHHTLSEQLALKDAHDKLTVAQATQAAAQANLEKAQRTANDAGDKGQQVLTQLAQVTAGQASASADTFTGHLKAIGAALEDNAAKAGGKAGSALIKFGPALAAAGFLIESGLIPKIGRGVLSLIGLGGQAATTAAEVEGSSVAENASLDTVVAAIRRVEAALLGIGPASATAAEELGLATTTMDAELAATGEAATVAGVEVGAGFTAMLGPIGLAAGALAGFLYLLNKANNNPLNVANLNAGTPNATIALPSQNPVITFNGKQYAANGSGLVSALPPLHPHSVQTDDAYDAKTSATLTQRLGMAGQKAKAQAAEAGKQTGKAAGDATLQAFLDSINGGKVANAAQESALSKQISAAQKTAADHAKALGAEVTAGLRAQMSTVKTEIAGVNDELKKMTDLRSTVVGQAASFTALNQLLPDNSRATAGGLVAALQARVGAEQLFGKNIQTLAGRGLDKGVIAEILKEGPQGRALASALVAGDGSQIAALNAAEKASRQQAQVLGSTAVDAEFGAGSQARANATLTRLLAEQKHTNALLTAEPALIAKAVQQAQKNAKVSTTTGRRTAVPR